MAASLLIPYRKAKAKASDLAAAHIEVRTYNQILVSHVAAETFGDRNGKRSHRLMAKELGEQRKFGLGVRDATRVASFCRSSLAGENALHGIGSRGMDSVRFRLPRTRSAGRYEL